MTENKYTYEDFVKVMSAIVEKRKEAESMIAKIIKEFEEETGMIVKDIEFESSTIETIVHKIKKYNVSLKIDL